jgi:hypothetical protein
VGAAFVLIAAARALEVLSAFAASSQLARFHDGAAHPPAPLA